METVGSNQSQSCQSEETGEDHEGPPRNAVGINAKTVESERQSKSASILGGIGWNGLEWVWRGYNFGYKKPIVAFLDEMGFS